MNNVLVVIATLFFHFNYGSSTISTIMGYRNTKYEYADLNSSIISSTPHATLPRCLSYCLQNGSCLGIMLQRSTGSCKLLSFNNAEQPTVGAHVLQPGEWMYYQPIKDCNNANCRVDKGYYFILEICLCIKYFSDPNSYTAASLKCQDDGAELIKIDSALKQACVKQYLDPLVTPGRIYIQGRKRHNKWVFDDNEEMQYFDWAIGQPSNNGPEDNIFISPTNMYHWHDGGGHGIYAFLCEL